MNTDTSELWREHEFIVRVNRSTGGVTHVVSVYGDNELFEDQVFDSEENRLTKHIFVRANQRQETEYNKFGHVHITRHIEPGELGTFVVQEASHGSLRSEKFLVKTFDGKKVMQREQLISNGSIQSESETHFAPNGKDPSISKIKSFAKDGRVTRIEQVLWHGENRPAVSESIEYDWYGVVEAHTKTLLNEEGDPLWEERVELKT